MVVRYLVIYYYQFWPILFTVPYLAVVTGEVVKMLEIG